MPATTSRARPPPPSITGPNPAHRRPGRNDQVAEGRMLRKKVSIDERVAQLGAHSALLYVLSIPHLDREGRMDGAPVAVRGTVVPYIAIQHPDEWTDGHVAAYITEWTQTLGQDGHPEPLVHWYCVRGLWVCQFPGFAKNQRIRFDRESPSRFPAPPGDLLSSIVPTIAPPAVAAAPAVGPADAAPLPGADPDTASDASPGPLGERLFADPLDPSAVTGPNARNAASEPDPGQIRTQAEVEVQVQPLAGQREVSRARADRNLAALPEDEHLEERDPLAEAVLAGVARRQAALATHGPLAPLLALLPDADANTPRTLHALFDPLGDEETIRAAVGVAIHELEIYQGEIRRPSAYVVGIAKRLASTHRRRALGRRSLSGRDELAEQAAAEAQWERIEAAAAFEAGAAS